MKKTFRIYSLLACLFALLLTGCGKGELTPAEKAKFEVYMTTLPANQRTQMEQLFSRMDATTRLSTIRSIIEQPGSVQRTDRTNGKGTAISILDDLRLLDSAVLQYSLETHKEIGFNPSLDDLRSYLRAGTALYNTGGDALGNAYGPFTVGSTPMLNPATFNALSDVADAKFWSPYK